MKAIGIIPARYGSKRFPGKALASDTGKPLIQHVYEAAARSRRLEVVVVATDEAEEESLGALLERGRANDVEGLELITGEEVRRGFDALLEFADEAVKRGGCPLSEHGVGRNPVKQEMLRRFVGAGAIDRMREIKTALDPGWRLARGVLFPPR